MSLRFLTLCKILKLKNGILFSSPKNWIINMESMLFGSIFQRSYVKIVFLRVLYFYMGFGWKIHQNMGFGRNLRKYGILWIRKFRNFQIYYRQKRNYFFIWIRNFRILLCWIRNFRIQTDPTLMKKLSKYHILIHIKLKYHIKNKKKKPFLTYILELFFWVFRVLLWTLSWD